MDHHDRDALVVLDGEEIRAVARYDRRSDEEAEFAVVVEDSWQDHRIGTELLHRVCRLARRRGFRRMVADTLTENYRMLDLLRRSGLPAPDDAGGRRRLRDPGSGVARLVVTGPSTLGRPAGRGRRSRHDQLRGAPGCGRPRAPPEMRSTVTDPQRLEVLAPDECLRLLAATRIGRVAVNSAALPAIFPVNFVVTPAGIVFRSNPGTKLAAATSGSVVAFEVDHANAQYHGGWSVLVVGMAHEIIEPAELAAARALPLRSWASNEADHYVRISLDLVSGQRIRSPEARTP